MCATGNFAFKETLCFDLHCLFITFEESSAKLALVHFVGSCVISQSMLE